VDTCGPAGDMSGTLTCHHDPDDGQCDDGDACTTDVCTSSGCSHSPMSCSDGNSCTVDTCSSTAGCIHTVDCDDGVPCTMDSCGPAGDMSGTLTCHHDPDDGQCDDGDACTTDVCTSSGCANIAMSCDDDDACTDDFCEGGVCGHEPVTCIGGDACAVSQCTDGECGCTIDPGCAAEGCTAGFWKTNAQKRNANAWPAPFEPDTKVTDVFDVPDCVAELRAATFLRALGFAGGPSLKAAAQGLVRSAVTAVLDAASDCVQYPACFGDVVTQVDAALASCNRGAMREVTAALEELNHLGCPLDQRGQCLTR
jgi:hypothetical protein